MKLNNSTLAQIPIDKPSYNRDEIAIRSIDEPGGPILAHCPAGWGQARPRR